MDTNKGKGKALPSTPPPTREMKDFELYGLNWRFEDNDEHHGFTTSEVDYKIALVIGMKERSYEYFETLDALQKAKAETLQYDRDVANQATDDDSFTWAEEALYWTMPDGKTHNENSDWDRTTVRTWGCKDDPYSSSIGTNSILFSTICIHDDCQEQRRRRPKGNAGRSRQRHEVLGGSTRATRRSWHQL
jgi:hypothetical protein